MDKKLSRLGALHSSVVCTPIGCRIVKDIIVSCDIEFLPNNKNELISATFLNEGLFPILNEKSSQVDSMRDHSHLVNAVRILPYTETIDEVDSNDAPKMGGDDRDIGPKTGRSTEITACAELGSLRKPIRVPIKNFAFHNTKYDLVIGLVTILELQLMRIYANKFSLGTLPDGGN